MRRGRDRDEKWEVVEREDSTWFSTLLSVVGQ